MNLQALLDQKNITKYQLSKMSGIPKTTIIDICSGKSDITKCAAKTVFQLAKALDCSMENIMELQSDCDGEDGLPRDKAYLECGLPEFLEQGITAMKDAWRKLDNGEEYLRWDCDYCSLQSDINIAEVSQQISSEQAWYLREKYLRMERM